MNEPTIAKIQNELTDELVSQKFGKIFVLGRLQLAIDFRLPNGKYLFISLEPNAPRIYMIRRKMKELEKSSDLQLPFVSFLRKRLAHAVLQKIEKPAGERILKFGFAARNEFGESVNFILVVQLTGRSSNLFLLDADERILDSHRNNFGTGQETGDIFAPPPHTVNPDKVWNIFPQGSFSTLSEALDHHYREREKEIAFKVKAQTAKANLQKELKKEKRLLKKLNQDLKNHGDAEKWKKYGDLLLANIATAERIGDKIKVTDYFDETTPLIEIDAEINLSVSEAAEKYFRRYTKARNAEDEITKRRIAVGDIISILEDKLKRLEQAIADKDLTKVISFVERKSPGNRPDKKTNKKKPKVYREFISSDGFDIFVGKRSKDNDYLTFRIAGSFDTWMHAADYPGSHVVIRNPNRREIPFRTVLEAAQLAAFYSKARNESKVGVHYTQKKFVNKPKGAAPGLVSLSGFKTILVEPKVMKQKDDG